MKNIVLVFIMIMGVVSSYAQALVGLIVDQQSNPIPSVVVTVKASDGNQYYTFSKEDGTFTILGCPPGNVIISVKKDSYESGFVRYDYKLNDTGLLCITMPKSNQYRSSNNASNMNMNATETRSSNASNMNTNATETRSSNDGSVVTAVIAGAVGAAIIGGVASAIKKSSSSSSSSSNSSSSNNKNTGPEPGRKSYNNVEIVDWKIYDEGKLMRAIKVVVRVRNRNSYSVVAKVQCRFSVVWEDMWIRDITIPAGGIGTVEITGPQNSFLLDTRILTAY